MELSALLEKLKLEHLDAQLDAVCEQAAGRDLDYKSFLAQALEAEWQGRFQRGIEARVRVARFPWIKTLDQFDFEFQPSLDRKQVRELAGLSFVERAQNVVILGPPGTNELSVLVGRQQGGRARCRVVAQRRDPLGVARLSPWLKAPW